MEFKNRAAMVVTLMQFWKDSGMGLVFWFSYERNFNFLVTFVNSKL